MICPNCNNNVVDGSNLCNWCGYRFQQQQPNNQYQQFQPQQPVRPQYNNLQPQNNQSDKTGKSGKTFIALLIIGIIWFIAYVAGADSGILWTFAIIELLILASLVPNMQKPNMQNDRVTCKRCGSTNINISINTYGVVTRGESQKKKKSLARRTATKAGRGMANMATMGMYGVFSKKPSKYVEVSKNTTTMRQEKTAICQNCGYSWRLF